MKRFWIEMLISLAYPALVALCACSFLMLTAQPGVDGESIFTALQGNVLLFFGFASLLGIILYAVWDSDNEPCLHFLIGILLVVMRIVAVFVLFYPFFFLWVNVLGFILQLF